MTTAAADPADPGVRAGDVLAGKYQVERVLGRGGMGVVVAAHHLQLDERVALKFLLPAALSNPEAVSRFDREARAAVKIKSEHVARVTDVGRLESGAPYMVMEYLEGVDLGGWLKQQGPMPVEQAVEFVLQACEAIAEAHALGIVHRDLKPANLFCVRRADGMLSVKVLDFGISKVVAPGSNADKEMTRTSAILGSPFYMSPEQIQSSKGVDSRSDIWSLGVILFELVAGRVPFEAESVTELVVRIATVPPMVLRGFRPDLPPGFDHVVMRCLEKERERRFQNVAELAIALADYGPPRARASVERVLRTLQTAGLSQAVLPPPGEYRAMQGSMPGVAPAPSGPALGGRTASSWGQTGAGERKSNAGVIVALACGGLAVLLGTGAAVAWKMSAHSAGSAASGPPPASSALAAPSSPPTSTPATGTTSASTAPASPASALATASASSAAAPAASAVLAPSAAVPSATPHPASPLPLRPASGPAAQGARPGCDPPYYYDAHGNRAFKPECL